MANEQLHIDGGAVVDAAAHADRGGSAPQHHACQADVLGHHHVVRFEPLDDGEVGGVGPGAHRDRVGEEPVVRRIAAAGAAGVARVVPADVPLEVLGAVAHQDCGHSRRPRAGEGLLDGGARVGVDIQGSHKGRSVRLGYRMNR